MHCIKCLNKCKVIDSRDKTYFKIRRRYECKKCHFRFTTYECAENNNDQKEIDYVVPLDSKHRLEIKNPAFNYYQIKYLEDHKILLEPKIFVNPHEKILSI